MFAISCLLVGALCLFGCHAFQRKLLFYPSHHSNENGFTRWTREGEVIGYAREVTTPRNVWLMLHGNGGQATDRQYAMFAFAPSDSVFILEYPGYGHRAGTPSRKAFDEAAREGYADLRARFPGIPVCVVGESIGSGSAAILAREKPAPDKIVLLVPFDDIPSVGHDHVSWLPSSLILFGTWNNVEALRGYRGPIDIFGAENDEVIPVKHARALADSLPQAKFHLLPGGHGWANQSTVAIRNP